MLQLRLSHYQERPPPIPSDFTYAGKPIEAACMPSLLDAEAKSILLEDCKPPANILDCALSENHDHDPWWDLRGYRGYCYVANQQQYNVIYKYLGRLGGHYAVMAQSARETSSSARNGVMLLNIQGDPPALVLVKMLSNDSTFPLDARIHEGKVLYTASVQGPQLAELAGASLSDLPDSRMMADCDIAEFENGTLKRVWLAPHAHYTNHCFELNHRKYLAEKRTELSAGELKTFMTEVAACIRTAR